MERSLDKISAITSKTVPFFGVCFRVIVKVPLLGKSATFVNKLAGQLLPKISLFGFRKAASFENAVWNYEIFLKLIGAHYKVESASLESRPYFIHKCPAGYCRLEHLNACKTTMELNKSLVESSGARLVVDKCSPIDSYCIEKIVRKQALD